MDTNIYYQHDDTRYWIGDIAFGSYHKFTQRFSMQVLVIRSSFTNFALSL